jgi:protein ImuB
MFAVLYVADFALQAVLRNEPAIARRPAALFAATTKKSVVLAANPHARAAHVELGMTASQAIARCPALVIHTVQPEAAAEAQAALLAVGFTLSPSIEATAPGICTVDLKGADFAQLTPTAQAALTQLARFGLPAACGLAATPLLALYAARHVSTHTFPLENPATSPRILHVAHSATFLAPLPLATADPSPELADVLAHWGIRTLGDLTSLPRDEIVRRFGAEGLALWNRATGGSPRPLRPVTLPQSFSAAIEFEDSIETLEPLLFILRRFLERLSLELTATFHVAAEIALALSLEDETQVSRSFRLPEPTADVEILFRTLHTHLESIQTSASVTALELHLTPTRPLVRQQGLFESGLRDPHGFAETLARAMAIIGPDRVGTPQLEDTHRPDAFTLTVPADVITAPASAPVHPALGLPLRRYRPPLPARLELTDGRATYLWTDHFHGEITTQLGPWPSNGHWWQSDRAWQRTEWDIALATGGLYRLLQIGDTWFLEGEYD